LTLIFAILVVRGSLHSLTPYAFGCAVRSLPAL